MLHARLQEDDHEERENRCLVTNVHHPSLVPDTDGAGAFGHRPECDPILERDHLIESFRWPIVEDQLTVSIRVFSTLVFHACRARRMSSPYRMFRSSTGSVPRHNNGAPLNVNWEIRRSHLIH